MFSFARSWAAIGAVTATALLAGRAQADEPLPIYGGSKVAPCAWPTTVSLGGCTGTLVHPELVIFAAHCMSGGYGPSTVTFGDNENYPAFSVGTTSCKADPKYSSSSGRDVAYCKLSQAVTHVPIVPILMGCETQVLGAGASVVAVGFGEANDGLGWGPKRAVTMTLHGVSGGEAHIGGNGKDTCYGDSGGPVYVRLGDGSWRVFGITSYGEYCGAGGYYSMMHTAIDWLEQSSGLDLTPCHQQGQWAPTESCGHFPMDPDQGGAAWSSGCATGNVSPMSATCGAPAGDASGGSGGSGVGGSGAGAAGGSGPGGSGGFGGSGGVGATAGVGGSDAPPEVLDGCSAAPDCNQCADCVRRCVCLTGDELACVDACEPYAPPGASGAAAQSNAAPDRQSDEEMNGGCTCRTAPPRGSWIELAAALCALVLGSFRARQREVTP